MDNLQNVMDQFATNPTYQIIAGIVLVSLIVILIIVWGLKRKKAKTISFGEDTEAEEPKELTQAEKSGNYTAQGGFNFAPAVKDKVAEPAPVQRGGAVAPEKPAGEQAAADPTHREPATGDPMNQTPQAGEPENQVTPVPAPAPGKKPEPDSEPAPEPEVAPEQNVDEPQRTPAPPTGTESVPDTRAVEEHAVAPETPAQTPQHGESVAPIPAPVESEPVDEKADVEQAVSQDEPEAVTPENTTPQPDRTGSAATAPEGAADTTDEPSDAEPAAPIFRDLADDTDGCLIILW